jgi:SAM-dependent methyltransferase
MKSPFAPYRPWYIIGDNEGQVPLSRQFAGLQAIDFVGKSVLEIGCAEGLVSLEIVRRGAKLVHGIEYRERAVEVARSIAGVLGLNDRAKFWHGDIRDRARIFAQPGILQRYDIVLAMAVLQKVPDQVSAFVDLLARAESSIALRMPARRLSRYRLLRTAWSWSESDPVATAAAHGFAMTWEACGYPEGAPPYSLAGEAWLALFERRQAARL